MLPRRIERWTIEAFQQDPPLKRWRFVATHDYGNTEAEESNHAPEGLKKLAALIGVNVGELLALYSL